MVRSSTANVGHARDVSIQSVLKHFRLIDAIVSQAAAIFSSTIFMIVI